MNRKAIKIAITTLLYSEYIIHAMVAVMLLIATFMIFVQAFWNVPYLTTTRALNLISNALLMMIVKEVLWTVIKFFKKQPFGISSFLYIGIISGIREMLFIEVQKSVEKSHSFNLTLELGINAMVIFILVAAYYLLKKSDQIR